MNEQLTKTLSTLDQLESKLKESQALNTENLHFITDNFFTKMSKGKLSEQQKMDIITFFSGDSDVSVDTEKQQALEAKKIALKESMTQLEQNILSAQSTREFLEENHIRALEDLEQMTSYEPDVQISTVYDIEQSLPDEAKIDQNIDYFFSKGSFFTKMKVAFALSSPASMKHIKQIIDDYGVEKFKTDYDELKNKLSLIATQEETVEDAKSRLASKNEEIDSLEEQHEALVEQLEEIEQEQQEVSLGAKGVQENAKNVWQRVISQQMRDIVFEHIATSEDDQLLSIAVSLGGFKSKQHVITLVSNYKTLDEKITSDLQSIAQVRDSVDDFIKKEEFKAKRAAIGSIESSEYSSLVALVNHARQNFESFFAQAFDAKIDDYFEPNFLGPYTLGDDLQQINEVLSNEGNFIAKNEKPKISI